MGERRAIYPGTFNPTERWLDFSSLWKYAGGKDSPGPIYVNLLERYTETHRHYHKLTHIDHCLCELKSALHLAPNPNAVKMAIWFHDAIYKPASRGNERESARLFLSYAKEFSLPIFAYHVANLIKATEHGEYPLANFDARFLCDIDLSILGQPEELFDEYERQIRKEYWFYDKKEFAIGRSRILNSFLRRWTIYQTRYFFNKYEAQAQKNIARSIAQLSK